MIIRSSDNQPDNHLNDSQSSQAQDQANMLMITNTIEELRRKDPDLYARLRTDPNFRRLPLTQDPTERAELLDWFLSEVNTAKPNLFQGIRKMFRGK